MAALRYCKSSGHYKEIAGDSLIDTNTSWRDWEEPIPLRNLIPQLIDFIPRPRQLVILKFQNPKMNKMICTH